MPTHLDPAFLDPTPAPPVERDTETGDLFAQPVEEVEKPNENATEDPSATLRFLPLEQLAGRDLEHVAERVENLALVRLQVAAETLQPVRRRQRHTTVAGLCQPVGRHAFLVEQFGEPQSHLHKRQANASGDNVSTFARASTSIMRALALSCPVPSSVGCAVAEPTHVRDIIPDALAALLAPVEPLCLICRASYRVRRTSLCAACLYADDDAPSTGEASAA